MDWHPYGVQSIICVILKMHHKGLARCAFQSRWYNIIIRLNWSLAMEVHFQSRTRELLNTLTFGICFDIQPG